MSIRTVEGLYDYLSEELAWRKKELAALHSLVKRKGISDRKSKAILRSAIALLYAHWEGFCKNSSSAYLEFVAMQRMNFEELESNFIALFAQKKFHEATDSTKIGVYKEITSFYQNDLSNRGHIPYKNVINTEANLSSDVLREIIEIIGLDYKPFETKEKLIDEKLLKNRNSIAHGDYTRIDEQDFFNLYDEIIEMMQELRNQIDNSANLKSYMVA